MLLRVTAGPELSAAERAAVREVIDRATDLDGRPPVSDAALLAGSHGGGAIHVCAYDGPRLVGYGVLLEPGGRGSATAELVVSPDERGHGVGEALVAELSDHARDGMSLWAHGRSASAARLALALGYREARVLHQLGRSLRELPQGPRLPEGFWLRPFVAGADDDEFLRVNAEAFPHLPDQGEWGLRDLRARLAQPWYDPAGFLVAEGPGGMVGFHWTKCHPPGPVGEVYVLAVAPEARGRGLADALLSAGLRHLRRRGMSQVMLYVDGDNHPALGLYRRWGFTEWDIDVLYESG